MRKYCSRCGKNKDILEFYPSKGLKSGTQSWCKKCFSLYSKEKRQTKNIMNEHKKILEMFDDKTLLATYRGSISHNTFVPPNQPNSSDDVDLMGVYFAPVSEYIGLGRVEDVKESFIGQYDIVNYEFRKMVGMLLKANPNAMSILWLNDDHYLKKNIYGRALVDFRDLFISKRIYRTYTRYAEGELARLKGVSDKGYMGAKRKKLREKYGYDVRHASHCIRLLRMGSEFLDTGRLTVYRTKDAVELIALKNGEWTLNDVEEEARRLFEESERAYQKCDFPEEPQTAKVEKLVEEIMYNYITTTYKG